jgi:hypothetical protein
VLTLIAFVIGLMLALAFITRDMLRSKTE